MVVIFIVNSIYSKHKYKYEQFLSMNSSKYAYNGN